MRLRHGGTAEGRSESYNGHAGRLDQSRLWPIEQTSRGNKPQEDATGKIGARRSVGWAEPTFERSGESVGETHRRTAVSPSSIDCKPRSPIIPGRTICTTSSLRPTSNCQPAPSCHLAFSSSIRDCPPIDLSEEIRPPHSSIVCAAPAIHRRTVR